MKITLLSDHALRLDASEGPMTIEAPSVEQQYSPFHMLASALAYCTFSVMYSWATHARLDAAGLALEVRWEFAEDPHRVGAIHMTYEWPQLPEQRRSAALRVAETCAIHATLRHPPTITFEPA
ncbi:MAG TPA: OsmC family protein [Gemmatimonadaceae bacterium]|nr:OsmC family protein [Gemmatimonadaceae bacterium]